MFLFVCADRKRTLKVKSNKEFQKTQKMYIVNKVFGKTKIFTLTGHTVPMTMIMISHY